jgi:hypothetical protein
MYLGWKACTEKQLRSSVFMQGNNINIDLRKVDYKDLVQWWAVEMTVMKLNLVKIGTFDQLNNCSC